MAMASSVKSVAKLLTTPGKMVRTLDWASSSASVLTLRINKDSIHLAVASHPSSRDPVIPLPSILLTKDVQKNKRKVSVNVVRKIANIVDDWKVCGFLVSWPVQKTTKCCGASCGRVLYTLDELARGSDVFNGNRLVCLWDEEHVLPTEDEWGRTPYYGSSTFDPNKVTTKKFHAASLEQYQDRNTTAVDVWDDFRKVHWPTYSAAPPSLSDDEVNSGKSNWIGGALQSSSSHGIVELSWLDNGSEDRSLAML